MPNVTVSSLTAPAEGRFNLSLKVALVALGQIRAWEEDHLRGEASGAH
jgi:hypothetical protein